MIRTLMLISALWYGTTQAIISWQGSGCVYRNQTLIACDLRDVGHQIVLGGPLTDGALRPAAGDVYTLVKPGGEIEQARLVCRAYFAVWRG